MQKVFISMSGFILRTVCEYNTRNILMIKKKRDWIDEMIYLWKSQRFMEIDEV